MKQKKAKTDCLCGLSFFVLIDIRLDPFEKPFHKFVNNSTWPSIGLVLSSVFSCLETVLKHSPSLMKNYSSYPCIDHMLKM